MCYRAVVPKSVCKRSRACPASVKTRSPSLSLRNPQNEVGSHPVGGSRGQEIPRTLPSPSQHAPSPSQHQFSHASCSPLVDTAFVPQPLRAVRARRTKSREAARRATEGDHRRARVHPLSSGHSLTHSLHSSLSAICQRSVVALTATSCPADQQGGRLLRLSNLLLS